VNFMDGSIPTEFGRLTLFERLYLENNDFGGFLPSEIGLLTKMEHLFLQGNKFEGTVPLEFSNLQKLETVRLQENDLTGSVDDVFCGTRIQPVDKISADCGASAPEISCSCCNVCCEDLRECTV
jgi:hypothetical protein